MSKPEDEPPFDPTVYDLRPYKVEVRLGEETDYSPLVFPVPPGKETASGTRSYMGTVLETLVERAMKDGVEMLVTTALTQGIWVRHPCGAEEHWKIFAQMRVCFSAQPAAEAEGDEPEGDEPEGDEPEGAEKVADFGSKTCMPCAEDDCDVFISVPGTVSVEAIQAEALAQGWKTEVCKDNPSISFFICPTCAAGRVAPEEKQDHEDWS